MTSWLFSHLPSTDIFLLSENASMIYQFT